MSELTVTELCLPGMACPMPVLKTKKALATMAPGERLLVRSTDRHSLADLKDFCEQTGHVCLEQSEVEEEGRMWYHTLIQRKA